MYAVRDKQHRHLMAWCFTLPVYFILGAFAAMKAVKEIVLSPFYWDKTQHGVTADTALDMHVARPFEPASPSHQSGPLLASNE
jgi:ABC-type sugar transport system permease subunit